MRVLAGLDLDGATFTRRDWSLSGAAIGDACWGPTQLLRDLELRLGLQAPLEPQALRVARWAARMAKLAPEGRYYSRSFEVDALGTAASVLRLRDLLVEAGWHGAPIPDGGARLDAVHELEQITEPPLPGGDADRLAAVARELAQSTASPYEHVKLVEDTESWSTCWQRVFEALVHGGTRLEQERGMIPGADPDTDLGHLQRRLYSAATTEKVELRGDGSFVVIAAETSWQAAQAVAALLGRLPADRTVVIREHDAAALDNALATARGRTQGLRSNTPWRSALQVLPLALELAFEPKDPYRVLELLTLPLGPFQGFVGHALARALATSPGIGSPAWEVVKAELPARHQESARATEQLQMIAEWLEAPGADANAGAPISTLVAVVERVRSWLLSRIVSSPEDSLLLIAARHAADLRAALRSDPRPSLTLVQVRKLAESVLTSGTSADLLAERAGRVAKVDSPARLRAWCESVVWWSFTASPAPLRQLPWRNAEASALVASGLRFPDPAQHLAERAAAARLALCCATERLVLVVPRELAGQALAHHPLWDELMARSQLDEAALASVTVTARELLDPASEVPLRDRPLLAAREPIDLPGGLLQWVVPPAHIAPVDRFSPASLEALLGCPLDWVLRYRAGARSGGHSLPPLFLLNGTIGHRLVELLHAQAAFDLEESALRQRTEAQLTQLFEREGALLLRPGMSFERSQVRAQLVDSVVELARLLRSASLRIVAVEQAVESPWQGGQLHGRLDLLVAGPDGQHAIIDLKGGMSTYRDLLRRGQALQLAAYAFAQAKHRDGADWPAAAYFSLKRGKLFGLASSLLPHSEVIDGPNLNDTWTRVERSVQRALPLLAQGKVSVTGVRGAPALLEVMGVTDAEAAAHFERPRGEHCHYCRHDALCGRRWEALQ